MSETTAERATAVSVRDLGLAVRGRTLLANTSFDIPRGELCLMVGASGTGKSLTLSLLAGLLEGRDSFSVTGTISLDGRERRDPTRRDKEDEVGVVFQDFALLDDLDTEGNVRFAQAHGRWADERPRLARELLDELRLPHHERPADLSGGMKQRLALARALAYGPRTLFYDEPTSGLDPAMSRRIAAMIREAHDHHAMTTVIVTHDLESLGPIADRILLLDPEARSWREVARKEVDDALEALRHHRPSRIQDAPERPVPAPVRWLAHCGDFALAGARTLLAVVPRPYRARWGLHFFWHYLRLVALGSALPFMAIAGFIGGFIATYFLFGLLPFRGYTEPVLAEEFVGALGYASYRVLVPALVVILFAARGGAAIAADVGNRVLSRQMDAMRSFGLRPERYLLTGAVLAALVGIPILFLAADACARIAALAVYLTQHPGHGAGAFQAEFHRLLEGGGWLPEGTGWNLLKLWLGAAGTAGIAYHTGRTQKVSGSEVALGVTTVIIRATLFVLVVMTLLAPFEFAPE